MSKISQTAAEVLKLEAKALQDCAERLDFQSFEKTLSALARCLDDGKKIVVTGVGKSGKVGQKIAATLSSTGNLSVFLHPTEGLHGDLGVVQKGDAVLALSYSGNTHELMDLIPSLKERGVCLVGMGGNQNSQLAQACDHWLDVHVESEACPHNLAPTTSSTLTLAMGDALAVSLMEFRKLDLQSFAQNHPGGSIGKRMNLTVESIMHSGDQVGTVVGDAGVTEVVTTLTEKKLGGVLVVDGDKMVGLITEGDLRRSLKNPEGFFDLKARDMMTAKPTTVSASAKAEEALRLMEDRPAQISVLPVVDKNGVWQGLVRLHDIVQNF